MRQIAKHVGVWDLVTAAGLAVLGAGLWLIHPAACLVGVGGALFTFGLWGARRWPRAS